MKSGPGRNIGAMLGTSTLRAATAAASQPCRCMLYPRLSQSNLLEGHFLLTRHSLKAAGTKPFDAMVPLPTLPGRQGWFDLRHCQELLGVSLANACLPVKWIVPFGLAALLCVSHSPLFHEEMQCWPLLTLFCICAI